MKMQKQNHHRTHQTAPPQTPLLSPPITITTADHHLPRRLLRPLHPTTPTPPLPFPPTTPSMATHPTRKTLPPPSTLLHHRRQSPLRRPSFRLTRRILFPSPFRWSQTG
uniref:Uncharacterized protein n=1 Tax=Opuntia streptacantha TaxID=393608 RepID=A0A7C9FJA0_OPUST